jgi:diacylglycerol kinase (ATP)
MSTLRHPCVLLNPHAGGGAAARLRPSLEGLLKLHAPGVRLFTTPTVEEARALLRDHPPGTRVVLVGGDGSVHGLLRELATRGHELALLPFGSGNDTARALGLRKAPQADMLVHALNAPARNIDLGEVITEDESRLFVSSLAMGFDAAVGLRALNGPRWLGGLPRYLLATLQELVRLRTEPVVAQADGVTVLEGPALFTSVLNTPSYGGGMPLAPTARLDDGQMELVVAGQFNRLQALAMLPRLLAGQHLGHPQVQLHGAQTIDLATPVPLPMAADGEPMLPACQIHVRVLKRALRVVAGPG